MNTKNSTTPPHQPKNQVPFTVTRLRPAHLQRGKNSPSTSQITANFFSSAILFFIGGRNWPTFALSSSNYYRPQQRRRPAKPSPCQTRRERDTLLARLGIKRNVSKTADLLPGTLDMLILKAVSLKPLHGYGVLQRIRQISGDALEIPQGSLYPALYRLEHQDLIAAEWGQSDNNRRAKYYTLTAAGRRRLREETAGWNRLATAIAAALNTTSEEV